MRGQPGRMIGINTSCLAAIPGGGEWPGKALQDDAIPQGPGGGGGGWAGSVLVSTQFLEAFQQNIFYQFNGIIIYNLKTVLVFSGSLKYWLKGRKFKRLSNE
jgi:hypothetical protein